MGWLGRIFDRRDTWARMVLLNLSGVGYLLFGMQPHHPTAGQWALAVTAFTMTLVLLRWPLVSFLVQSGLLLIAFVTLDDPTINQVGASWMLAEVIAWVASSRVVIASVALMFGLYAVTEIFVAPVPLQKGIFGTILPIGVPLLFGMVIRTSRELNRQAEQRALAERQHRESESRAARADERGAIARELHDVVAHHVASMVLRAGVARHVLGAADPRVTDVLDDVHASGTAALTDLRRLVEVLRDPAAGGGDASLTTIDPGSLPAALGAAVDRARRTGVTVDVEIDEAVGTLDAVRGLAVLRLTQEALTNVVKHAGSAAGAHLRVALTGGAVRWEVTDDGGDGPGPSEAPGGGHGIIGMRERVTVLGGELEAGPYRTGWRVRTVLPAVEEVSA